MHLLAVLCLVATAACAPPRPAGPVPTHPGLVDDVAAARRQLEQERTSIRLASGEPPARRVQRLLEVGLLQDAAALLSASSPRTLELTLAEAELRFRQYRFRESRELVDQVLQQRPGNGAAQLLSIRLAVEAWQLDWAAELARALLVRGRRDEEAGLLLGRIHLLEREYDAALEWAERVRTWNTASAGAYLLEAEVHLWEERAAEAETALRRALELNPFDADARFAYGYALWRRGAPSLLVPMATQWNLALEIDPLHLRTHWHFGNGHTPLTYRDYAPVADTLARAALAPVDSLIRSGLLEQAVRESRRVEAEFPGSVLPALYRGSAWYLLGDRASGAPLDSAQDAFRTILGSTPNFGPAHNGLAAVLKQRQVRALARYDSLEAAVALTPVTMPEALAAVFPDLYSYPGDRVARMVSQQLGPAQAFLPLLLRQGQRFVIPPLHHDVARATGNALLRASATFDNRRCMDIRGVGGEGVAAAGIEYLEGGSHQERGVLLHQFVHLVHATSLTDSQRRRVRELYLAALQQGRLLDYHAASNAEEFFAQAVEAFQSPEKVHPLNLKSTNTREDLRRSDPATFAFVEGLFAELERSLAGDAVGLRSNWAEAYVNLAQRALRGEDGGRPDIEMAAALVDSALVWDAGYLPAMVQYALIEAERGRPARAEEWLRTAEGIEPGYAPIAAARSEVLKMTGDELAGTGDTRAWHLRRAADLEQDPLLRGRYERDLWELYRALGRLPEAIAAAEDYAARGSEVSNTLSDLREDAVAAAMRMRMDAGYIDEALPYFRRRVAEKPLDFGLRVSYAEALLQAGLPAEAEETLADAHELLAVSGATDPGVFLGLAELQFATGDSVAAAELLEPLLYGEGERGGDGRLVRLLVSLGESTEAQRQLAALPAPREAAQRAELAFTRGWISAWRGDVETAEELYRDALAFDPYHRDARLALYEMLRSGGRVGEARAVADTAAALPLPLGPAFEAELQEISGGG